MERRRLHVGRATRDLGVSCTGAQGELAAQTRSRSPDLAVRKRAPKDPSTPRARPRRARRARGPGRGRRLAPRPRRGPSGLLPARRRGQPRSPRGTNRRNGSAEGEGARGQGPGAGRAAGPAPSRARPAAQSPSLPLQTADASLSQAGGREWSREPPGSGALRPRRPGHVPLSWPISPGRRGDVRAAAWRMTAGPPSRGRAHSNGRHRGDLRFPAARASAVVGW